MRNSLCLMRWVYVQQRRRSCSHFAQIPALRIPQYFFPDGVSMSGKREDVSMNKYYYSWHPISVSDENI